MPTVAASTTLPSPPTLAPPANQTAPIYCYFSGCKSKRLPAQNCTRRMCHTHCQLSGGCSRKDHIDKASTPLAATSTSSSLNHAGDHYLPPPDSVIDPLLQNQPATSRDPPIDPALQTQPATNPPLPPTPQSETPQSHTLRYTIQIPSVFTEQQAALQHADADR